MLLTITSTTAPATDLVCWGKARAIQTFDFAFGKAHVFYQKLCRTMHGRPAARY
jgi:hypothetical protein